MPFMTFTREPQGDHFILENARRLLELDSTADCSCIARNTPDVAVHVTEVLRLAEKHGKEAVRKMLIDSCVDEYDLPDALLEDSD